MWLLERGSGATRCPWQCFLEHHDGHGWSICIQDSLLHVCGFLNLSLDDVDIDDGGLIGDAVSHAVDHSIFLLRCALRGSIEVPACNMMQPGLWSPCA